MIEAQTRIRLAMDQAAALAEEAERAANTAWQACHLLRQRLEISERAWQEWTSAPPPGPRPEPVPDRHQADEEPPVRD